jgi:hypothetical protein
MKKINLPVKNQSKNQSQKKPKFSLKILNKLEKVKNIERVKSKFFVFDCETWAREARPENFAFGCLYGYNYKKVFHSIEDFKNEIFSPEFKNKYIFVHFAEFDLNVLFGNIKTGLDREAIFNGSTFIMASHPATRLQNLDSETLKKKGKVYFADSLNIYKTSVLKIGEMLGYPKLEMNKNFGQGKVFKITDKEIEYCLRDCEIVWLALEKIFLEVQSVRPTVASLSMLYFRRFYQMYHIAYNSKVIDFFDSYYGGRVEAFKLGKTNSYKYDINSMYPFIGSQAVFPNPKFIRISPSSDLEGLLYDMKYYEGQAEIEIYHKKGNFGYLPLKHNGKLIFPTGVFSGCWCFPEIRFALKMGVIEILKVNKVLISQKQKTPFKDFYNDLYKKRLNASGIMKDVLKLISNGNYGKWAQKEKHREIYYDSIPFELVESLQKQGIPYELKMFNSVRMDCYLIIYNPASAIAVKDGYVVTFSNGQTAIIKDEKIYSRRELKNLVDTPKIHTIPVYSSYITSLARVYLLQNILKYQDKTVTYTDTDCICIEKPVETEDSMQLGKFKREKEILIEIRGNKNYTQFTPESHKDGVTVPEKTDIKIKGIPKKAIDISHTFDIQTRVLNKTGSWEFENFVKTKTAIRTQQKSGTIKIFKKHLSGKYDKRKIKKTGFTSPIHFTADPKIQ